MQAFLSRANGKDKIEKILQKRKEREPLKKSKRNKRNSKKRKSEIKGVKPVQRDNSIDPKNRDKVLSVCPWAVFLPDGKVTMHTLENLYLPYWTKLFRPHLYQG